MNKRWRMTAVLLTAAALSLSLAACGAKPTTGAGSAANSEISDPAANTGVIDPVTAGSEDPASTTEGSGQGSSAAGGNSETVTEQQIKVYQTDDQLIDLKEVEAKISFSSEDEKLKAALEALASEGKDGNLSLWTGVEFKSVSVKDGALTVDIHIPDESRMGGPGEGLALKAITETVFQFDEIQSLDILVDGQAADSLMGHVELDHPINKSGI